MSVESIFELALKGNRVEFTQSGNTIFTIENEFTHIIFRKLTSTLRLHGAVSIDGNKLQLRHDVGPVIGALLLLFRRTTSRRRILQYIEFIDKLLIDSESTTLGEVFARLYYSIFDFTITFKDRTIALDIVSKLVKTLYETLSEIENRNKAYKRR